MTNSNSEQWTVHPLAAVWPMLSEDDLQSLADDINDNGLRHPIVINSDGEVIDGRNRLAACRLAGVVPEFVVDDSDPLTLIRSENSQRRHVSTGQRAMCEALMLVADGKRKGGRWVRGSLSQDSGLTQSTWGEAMRQAGTILDYADELAPRVADGTEALDSAYKAALERKKYAERVSELPDDLRVKVENDVLGLEEALQRVKVEKRRELIDADLLELVDDGRLDLGEAEATMVERKERLESQADRVRAALSQVERMIGYPIPDGLRERLTDREIGLLEQIIKLENGASK